MSTADAPAREAAWLATSGDGLPALLQTAGGPWQTIQAYWPRTPDHMAKSVFVLRHQTANTRFANVRKLNRYVFRLICWWPMVNPNGDAQQAQADFDAALDLLLQRIAGPVLDKTHGGRFLSVGETAEHGGTISIDYHDPVQTLASGNFLVAEITYGADDNDYND